MQGARQHYAQMRKNLSFNFLFLLLLYSIYFDGDGNRLKGGGGVDVHPIISIMMGCIR